MAGGGTQIVAELFLLREAAKTPHMYYHLLSGNDLPIKSNQYIYQFFDSHLGEEFIHIDRTPIPRNYLYDRINEYHFLQDYIGRGETRIQRL